MPVPTVAARLDLAFDPTRLEADLARLPDSAWKAHFFTERYVGRWSGVALRAVEGRSDSIVPAPGASGAHAPTPWLRASPYFTEVLATFECPLRSVRLLKLDPRARILEHRDPDLGPGSGLVRLHLPVRTNPQVEFYVAGERVRMAPGECWFLDLGRPHAVTNAGKTPRVHLVIDCVLDAWLHAQFESAGITLEDGSPNAQVRPEELPHVVAELRRLGTETALSWADRLERGEPPGGVSDDAVRG